MTRGGLMDRAHLRHPPRGLCAGFGSWGRKKLLFAACLGDIHWQVAEERQGVEAVAQIAPAEQRDLTGSLRPN